MTPFFVYLIKSSVSLALLYILFRLAMRNDRMHTLNRFLLLGILLFSALIPFLNIQFLTKEVPVQQVEKIREFISTPVFAPETAVAENVPVEQAGNFSINPYLVLYAGIILFLLTRLLVAVIRVLQLIKNAQMQKFSNIVLAVVKEMIQPFTFLDKIVLSEKDFKENKDMVIAHEHAHIKHWHAVDLVVCELFYLLHFFNPFMWLLRHDLKMIHEYQADQAVLNKGIDAQKYQLLVLEKAVGERRFALANHFTQKPILKRFKMMKKRKKPWTGVKLLIFVPVLLLLLQAFARPELITKPDDFVPVKYTENKTEQWLQKWTIDKIGKGFFQPALESPDAPRKPNNVLVILMNSKNKFLIENQKAEKEDIKSIVKNYLLGVNPDGKRGPDFVEKEIPFVGKMKVSKGIISYRHDLESSPDEINSVLRSIGEACLEVRNEKARILFGKDYFDLDEEKQEAVNEAVPVWFSYELPKAPNPSVWLPFDRKPSKPDPINITFKENGNVLVENHKFNSFEEFEENLKHWDKDLNEYNKNERSKGFYRANVTFEDISGDAQKNICYILYKHNVHIGHITGTSAKPNLVDLEKDKLQTEVGKNIKRADSLRVEMSEENYVSGQAGYSKAPPLSTSQKTPKRVDVHLNQNKLYFDGNFCKLEDLKSTVEKYLAKNPDVKMVRLILHQPDALSSNIIEKSKAELNKIENVETKVIHVAVANIKKKTSKLKPGQSSSQKLEWTYSNLNDIGQVTTIKEFGEHGEYKKSQPVGVSNVLWILVNKDDKVLVNGTFESNENLSRILENFFKGKLPNGNKILSWKTKSLPELGNVSIPCGVISYRFDIKASYLNVQKICTEIGQAYSNVRNETSTKYFNQPYLSLSNEKRKIIDEVVPIFVTTGEPKLNKETKEVVFYK